MDSTFSSQSRLGRYDADDDDDDDDDVARDKRDDIRAGEGSMRTRSQTSSSRSAEKEGQINDDVDEQKGMCSMMMMHDDEMMLLLCNRHTDASNPTLVHGTQQPRPAFPHLAMRGSSSSHYLVVSSSYSFAS